MKKQLRFSDPRGSAIVVMRHFSPSLNPGHLRSNETLPHCLRVPQANLLNTLRWKNSTNASNGAFQHAIISAPSYCNKNSYVNTKIYVFGKYNPVILKIYNIAPGSANGCEKQLLVPLIH